MKPVVLTAQSKELQNYLRTLEQIDRESLVIIHKKLLKMQLEVSEMMEKNQ